MHQRAIASLLLLLAATTPLTGQIRLPNPLAPQQSHPAPGDSAQHAPSATPPLVEPGSPRHSMEQFFQLTNEGKWHAASRFMALPQGTDSAKAAHLAERLKVILDRYLWVDLDQVSPRAIGDTADGLSDGTEQLGVIPRPNGLYEPVRLLRVTRDGQPTWVFAPSTVGRVGEWYGDLGDNWIRELFPEALRRSGPLRVQWWQWLALLLAVPLVIVVGTILERFIILLLQAITRRTAPTWDNALVDSLRAPLLLFCVSLFIGPVVNRIGLNASVQSFLAALIKAMVTTALFWAVIRALDVVQKRVIASAWAGQRADVLSLAPLGGRLAKLFVGFLGVTAVLAQFSIPVGTLLAGLGIGGIAVALAAQKTLENVIGSLSIVGDKPFEVGDWVRVEDVEGTVESVRLRSTQIRTFDRTLVTYPNGRLADMRLESLAARDRFRVNTRFTLRFDTTRPQVDGIAQDVEAWFRAHPQIWPDLCFCRLVEFGESGMVMEATAWFLVPDMAAFRPIRHEVLLTIREIVEGHGTMIAVPARRVVSDQPGASPATPTGEHVPRP